MKPLILSLLWLLVFPPPEASAQKLPWSSSGKSADTKPAGQAVLPATEEEIDKESVRIESRLKDFRARKDDPGETSFAETAGLSATPGEARQYQRLGSELMLILEKHVLLLNELKEIRKANKDRESEQKAWTGFAEKPPFPISFIDSLRDDILSQRLDIQALEIRLLLHKGNVEQYSADLKRSRTELRIADEQAGASPEPRKQWLLELARLRNDLNEAAVLLSELQRLTREEAIAGKKKYIRFLEEKLSIAEASSPLTKEDLEKKLGELDALRKTVKEEFSKAIRDYEDAKKKLQLTRDALTKVQADIHAPATREKAHSLRLDLEAQQVVTDTYRLKTDGIKGHLEMVNYAQGVWEDRFWLTEPHDLAEKRQKLNKTKKLIAGIELVKNFFESSLTSWMNLSKSQRDKLAGPHLTRAEQRTGQLILGAYEERLAMTMKLTEEIGRMERLANRLNDELERHIERASVGSRLKERYQVATAFLKSLWNTELYVAEESVIVEDKKIVKPVSVTIGKVFKAVAILIAGTWVSLHLIRPVRWMVSRKLKKGESTAQQFGKVLFLVLFICVLVFSLVSVNIPLEVFAFLGGALAIGIGFGAQNLINNFISGLILLFDRSIRVGDIIEIDGQGGRVMSIGMRSSLIRRFDDVELLVPNSQFLEQKVTNRTLTLNRMRYPISVGVAYGSPTEEVARLIRTAVTGHELVLKSPEPMVIFEDFGESALSFTVYLWLELVSDRNNLTILSDIRHRITALFRDAGIVIAFPQRDVHIDSLRPIEVKVLKNEKNRVNDTI